MKTMTLRQALTTGLIKALVRTVLLVGSYTGVQAILPMEAIFVSPEHDAPAVVVNPVQDMIDAHGCWTSNGPEGVIPGHVVVTLDGDTTPTYGGLALTTKALNQALLGEGHVGQVHAFCR